MRIKIKNQKQLGLLGNPLGHSVSPFIHRELLLLRGITCDYGLYEVEKDDLKTFFEKAKSDLDGFNVTIPYKIDIIPFLDALSPGAELFGSVNTVSLDGAKATGYNTDCTGFLCALEGEGIALSGKVLILGCGGVARMFAFESALAGADVTLAVRESSLKKANTLKSEIKEKLDSEVEIITIDSVRDGYDLIVNGTPVGMSPEVDKSPLEKEVVLKSKAVFDAIYNPQETLLLKYAKEGGLKAVNGLSMLVWQAAAADEIWCGIKFEKSEVDRVISIVKKELEKR